MKTDRRAMFALIGLLVIGVAGFSADPPAPPPVRVIVVVVLASKDHDRVDPKLAALAAEVRKRHEDLTGFKLAAAVQKSIPVGDSHTFELADGKTMKMTVESSKDKTGRIAVTLHPPGLDEIKYACVCDKFVPVITPHVTKAGERLIIAVQAKPCTGK
jgi:hypothetical protein